MYLLVDATDPDFVSLSRDVINFYQNRPRHPFNFKISLNLNETEGLVKIKPGLPRALRRRLNAITIQVTDAHFCDREQFAAIAGKDSTWYPRTSALLIERTRTREWKGELADRLKRDIQDIIGQEEDLRREKEGLPLRGFPPFHETAEEESGR